VGRREVGEERGTCSQGRSGEDEPEAEALQIPERQPTAFRRYPLGDPRTAGRSFGAREGSGVVP